MYNRENCHLITSCTSQHSTILDVRFSTENVNKKSACISCHIKVWPFLLTEAEIY